MQELNSTDFEYDCDDNLFLESNEKRNRIKKLIKYRYEFYELMMDYLCINYRKEDIQTAINLIYNFDYTRIMQPLCYKFNCSLYHDVEEVALELEKFKQFVIVSMKNLAKVEGNEALEKGVIRDSNGKDRTDVAFRVMEKALTAAKMKKDGYSNKKIFNAIFCKNPDGKDIKKAKNHIDLHLKNAKTLMERVRNGTFPYNEDGEWKLK